MAAHVLQYKTTLDKVSNDSNNQEGLKVKAVAVYDTRKN